MVHAASLAPRWKSHSRLESDARTVNHAEALPKFPAPDAPDPYGLDASGAAPASVYVVPSDQRVIRHPAASRMSMSASIATAPDAGEDAWVEVAIVFV